MGVARLGFIEVMKPSGPIVEAAIRQFGQPNWSRSTAKELRFGTFGSVSVNVADGLWWDFDDEKGGKVQVSNVVDIAPSAPRLIVKKYDYVDEHGKQLMQVCRYMPKDFRQRRMGPDGKWIWRSSLPVR